MSTANQGNAAGLEYKAAAATPDVGLLDHDDATGIVEALVSVTGVRDHDNDIIEPGAYARTLKVRTPKGIFHHDWHKWASKTLAIEELMPGDARLPHQMKDGQPWPEGAGALWVKTQYNLATTQGRDAYENVKFYGPECEWSVGYRVPAGKSTRGKDGVRRIKEIDLFEYSPVLFGANSMSSTLAVKTAKPGAEDDGDDWQDLDAEAEQVPDDALESLPEEDDEEDDTTASDDDTTEEEEEEDTGEEDETQDEGEEDTPDPAHPADAADEEKGSSASLDRSPRQNWVEKAGELPPYIREIARSIHEKRGTPLDRAIPIAIATVKRWAKGGGDVSAETQAKAAKAVAEWEKLKANSSKKQQPDTIESTLFPHLPGTYEELREQIRQEAAKAFPDATHLEVVGTWPTSAVITCYTDDGTKAYDIPYTLTVGDDTTNATVTLHEPEPVELSVAVDGQEEDGEKLLPFPSQIEDAATGLKTWLAHAPESKAGRVLSAVNERRLLGAVESLVAVLKAAGLEIDARPKQGDEDEDPNEPTAETIVASDSTAPSARPDSKTIDPALLARGYRIAAEAAARRL